MTLGSCRTCGVYITDDNPHDQKACAAEKQAEINRRGAAKARQAMQAAKEDET